VWVQECDVSGKPIAQAFKITPAGSDVDDLKKAIKAKLEANMDVKVNKVKLIKLVLICEVSSESRDLPHRVRIFKQFSANCTFFASIFSVFISAARYHGGMAQIRCASRILLVARSSLLS